MTSVAGTVLRAPLAARTWREVGYTITGTVLAVPTFALALLGLVFSALSLLTVGLPLLTAVLVLARLTVRYFRGPARLFLGWTWPNPPPVRRRGPGPLRWAGAVLTDASAWKALAYCFARLPLMAAAAYLGGALVAGGLIGITYPVWMQRFPQDPPWGGPGVWPRRGWPRCWCFRGISGSSCGWTGGWWARCWSRARSEPG